MTWMLLTIHCHESRQGTSLACTGALRPMLRECCTGSLASKILSCPSAACKVLSYAKQLVVYFFLFFQMETRSLHSCSWAPSKFERFKLVRFWRIADLQLARADSEGIPMRRSEG